MKEFKREIKVLAIKRLRNSYYSNPQWEIAFQYIGGIFDDLYHTLIATTRKNASCGYLFHQGSVNKHYEITYYFTKSGNAIIETAEEVHKI